MKNLILSGQSPVETCHEATMESLMTPYPQVKVGDPISLCQTLTERYQHKLSFVEALMTRHGHNQEEAAAIPAKPHLAGVTRSPVEHSPAPAKQTQGEPSRGEAAPNLQLHSLKSARRSHTKTCPEQERTNLVKPWRVATVAGPKKIHQVLLKTSPTATCLVATRTLQIVLHLTLTIQAQVKLCRARLGMHLNSQHPKQVIQHLLRTCLLEKEIGPN